MNSRARFLRQVLLPEIGERGQRRIADSIAGVGGDPASLAHEIASLYALRAGFRAVAPGPIDAFALAPEAEVTTPAAREVLAGARAALSEIRRVIAEREE